LSDSSAKIYLDDLIHIILDLHEAGNTQPLITKVGSKLKERYPQLFSKGLASRLATEAQRMGLLKIGGRPPKRYLIFKASDLEIYDSRSKI